MLFFFLITSFLTPSLAEGRRDLLAGEGKDQRNSANLFSVSEAGDTSMSPEAIKQRTLPVGKVLLQGQSVPMRKPFLQNNTQRSGREVYETTCVLCHEKGVAGSPPFGNKESWLPRLKKGEEMLLKHALNGYNFMPPRGSCDLCTDDEIKAAIQYMIQHSQ